MGIVFRQSIKSTAVIMAGNLIGALVIYYSAHVFAKDTQQFGFSRTILNLSVVSVLFLLFGVSSLIQIFAQRYPGKDKRKKVLITLCTLVPLAATLLLLPFYILFRTRIIHLFQPEDWAYFSSYYLWIPLLVLMFCYVTLFEAYMVSQHKTAQGMVMRELFLRVCNLGILAALFFGLITFHGYIIYTILSYCVAAVLLLLLSARTEGFGFSFEWKLFSKGEYREMLHFSWYHLLMGVSLSLIGMLDSLMLATLDKDGVASVPVYTVAVFIVALTTIPYRAMAGAAFPVLNKAYINKDQAEISDVFRRSGINILIVAAGMTMIVALNLENAVAILPKGYALIVPLVLILMLGRMVDMATGLNGELISISENYKFNFRIALGLVVLMVAINYLLIPRYGAYGAAWGTSISLVIYNIVKMIFLQKKVGLQSFSMKSLQVILIAGAVAAGGYFIPFILNPFVDVIIRTTVVASVYGFLLIRFRVSEDIDTYLASVKEKKRLF